MEQKTTHAAYTIALGGGALIWLAIALVSGKGEAWDSPLYWSVGYPVSILLIAFLGFRFPEKVWRWGLAVMCSQAVVLMFTAMDFSLLPLGLILFAILALPGIGLAYLAVWLHKRQGEQ